LRSYKECYDYDEVGNILHFSHYANGCSWVRDYFYEEKSQIKEEHEKYRNNRLTRTAVGAGSDNYGYNDHGSMTSMPHLQAMEWDFEEQLQSVDLGSGGTAFYVYDAGGQRVRKVIEFSDGRRKEERFYLGSFEVFRRYNLSNGEMDLERETLHIEDDKQRIALVETRTMGVDESLPQTIRYQLGNHLGSFVWELDQDAKLITYEEYYPYGSASFRAGRSVAEVKLKRYRYIGKEQDEETGLYYNVSRYYMPWLGRWTSSDPIGIAGGIDSYTYADTNPIIFSDQNGTSTKSDQDLPQFYSGCIEVSPDMYIPGFSNYQVENTQILSIDPKTGEITIEVYTPVYPPYSGEQRSTTNLQRTSSDLVAGLTGFGTGVAAANIPFVGPLIVPAAISSGIIEAPNRTMEFWYGAGESAAGAVQLFEGIALAYYGGSGTIFGVVGTPLSGGASLTISAIGITGLAAGLTLAGNGLANIGAGIQTMYHSSNNSSTTNGPRSIKDAKKISERNKKRLKEEDPDLVERYNDEKKKIDADTSAFPKYSEDELFPFGPNNVNIGRLRGSRKLDFDAANEIAGYPKTPDGYIWHHHEDLGRMQLVEESVHALRGDGNAHWGGVSIWQRVFNLKYK
jgi:RHS repeat-associated protein